MELLFVSQGGEGCSKHQMKQKIPFKKNKRALKGGGDTKLVLVIGKVTTDSKIYRQMCASIF